MNQPQSELTKEMVDALQGKTLVLLQAVDPASLDIYSTALSWVYARDTQTIHFAIDYKSPFLQIVKQNPKVALHFIGLESAYRIAGQASILTEKAEDISIHLALVKVSVTEVRDIMFYGGKVVTDPAFVKTYKPSLIEKLDREVEQALQQY